MTTDHKDRQTAEGQHVRGADTALLGEVVPGGVLEQELWRRRHERRESAMAEGLGEAEAALAPLVLSLARLAAHRDVRRRSQAQPTTGD